MKIKHEEGYIEKLLDECFNDDIDNIQRRTEVNKFIFENIEKFREKYEEKVIKNNDGCWGWKDAKYKTYPIVFYKVPVGAHRISYTIENGQIMGDAIIMHLCDNPICSNPKHLKIGTISENTAYVFEKNKQEYNSNFDKNLNVRLSVNIGVDIHTEIKKLAADKNISMKKWVIRAIMDKIKKEKEYI